MTIYFKNVSDSFSNREKLWGWEIQSFRSSPKGKKKPVSIPVL